MLKLIITILLFPLAFTCKSQISGRVIDKHTREPLPFAVVENTGRHKGTVTNSDGSFSIDTLWPVQVSFLGYKPVMITSGAQNLKAVELEKLAMELTPVEIKATTKEFEFRNEVKGQSRIVAKAGMQFMVHVPHAGKVKEVDFDLEKRGNCRLRIYLPDSTGLPGKDITPRIIKFNGKKVKLDSLYVPGPFFIGLEFLDNESVLKASLHTNSSCAIRSIGGYWEWDKGLNYKEQQTYLVPKFWVKMER